MRIVTQSKLLVLLCILAAWVSTGSCITDKVLESAYFLAPSKQHPCSDTNLKIANELRKTYTNNPSFEKYMTAQDVFIGYPEGRCGFVRDQRACAPTSCFDFLRLYYCSFARWMGDGWALILFGGVVVCVSRN